MWNYIASLVYTVSVWKKECDDKYLSRLKEQMQSNIISGTLSFYGLAWDYSLKAWYANLYMHTYMNNSRSKIISVRKWILQKVRKH